MKPLFLVTCLFTVGCGGRFELHLGRDQLQPVVEKMFPISVGGYVDQPLPADVTLHSPDIGISESSNRLSITSGISVAKPGERVATKPSPLPGLPHRLPIPKPAEKTEFNGQVTVSSELRYDADHYCFFAHDVAIDEFSCDGPELPDDELIRTGIAAALNRHLAESAIYEFSNGDTQSKIARKVLKSVSVRDGHFVLEFGS